jgi:AcrR family transcriptional regulator
MKQASPLPLSEHARRLLDAMAHCVSVKGYAATTIADIAAEARVSKRTFYEQFTTKAQCLIALYEAASRQALQVLKGAIDPAQDWHQQVEQALRAYFDCMASNPVLMRTLFIEMLALGPEGLAARRRAYRDLAELILQVVGPDVAKAERLPASLATAIVGGINELVLQAIEEDRVDRLHELTEPSARLVRAVVDHWR